MILSLSLSLHVSASVAAAARSLSVAMAAAADECAVRVSVDRGVCEWAACETDEFRCVCILVSKIPCHTKPLSLSLFHQHAATNLGRVSVILLCC